MWFVRLDTETLTLKPLNSDGNFGFVELTKFVLGKLETAKNWNFDELSINTGIKSSIVVPLVIFV